jgi:hypothetical protein
MVKRLFFTELHHIIHLRIPTNEDLYLGECEEVFMALVKTCKAEQDEHSYWKFLGLGGLEFIDLTMIRCIEAARCRSSVSCL